MVDWLEVYRITAQVGFPVALSLNAMQAVSTFKGWNYQRKKKAAKGDWLRVFYVMPNENTMSFVVRPQKDIEDDTIRFVLPHCASRVACVFDETKMFTMDRTVPVIGGEKCIFYHHSNPKPLDITTGKHSIVTDKMLGKLVDSNLLGGLLSEEQDHMLKNPMVIMVILLIIGGSVLWVSMNGG